MSVVRRVDTVNLVYILHVVFGFTLVMFVYKAPWNVNTIAIVTYIQTYLQI